MEIFNIHIFEFLLIAALALVVFGPERLPEVGRFVGKQVARFLAWQQQSPELRLINEIRGEFEREIATLRDELVRTRNQLDVSRDVEALRNQIEPMLNLRTDAPSQQPAQPSPGSGAEPAAAAPSGDAGATAASIPRSDSGGPAEAAAPPPAPDGADPPVTLADAGEQVANPPALTPQPAAQTVPAATGPQRLPGAEPSGVLQPVDERARYLAERRARLHDLPDYDDDPPVSNGSPTGPQQPETPAVSLSHHEREELVRQIQALSSELRALVGELRARGVIGVDWSPNGEHSQETVSR